MAFSGIGGQFCLRPAIIVATFTPARAGRWECAWVIVTV